MPSGRARRGAVPPGTAPFSLARSRWRSRLPAGPTRAPSRESRGDIGWPTRGRAPRRGLRHGQTAGNGGKGTEGGGRDEPRASTGAAGTSGQDRQCPDGGDRSLHPRGVDESRVDTSHRTPPVGARPSAFPARGRRSDVALHGRPRRGGDGCPVRAGAERGGAGACPGLGLQSRAAAEGGEGSREGGGSCSAAMQRRAEPAGPAALRRPSLRQCGWKPRPGWAEPVRASSACSGRILPQTRRAAALSRFLGPVSFSSCPCRDRGTFPPAAGRSRACVPGIAGLVLGGWRGPHSASGAERRRTPQQPPWWPPPAPRLLSAPPLDAGTCEAPGAAPTRGGSPVSALLRSSFSEENLPPPPYLSSEPHRLCFPISFSPSPLTTAQSSSKQRCGASGGLGVPPGLRFPAAAVRPSESQHRGRSWQQPGRGSPAAASPPPRGARVW